MSDSSSWHHIHRHLRPSLPTAIRNWLLHQAPRHQSRHRKNDYAAAINPALISAGVYPLSAPSGGLLPVWQEAYRRCQSAPSRTAFAQLDKAQSHRTGPTTITFFPGVRLKSRKLPALHARCRRSPLLPAAHEQEPSSESQSCPSIPVRGSSSPSSVPSKSFTTTYSLKPPQPLLIPCAPKSEIKTANSTVACFKVTYFSPSHYNSGILVSQSQRISIYPGKCPATVAVGRITQSHHFCFTNAW